MSQTLDNVNAHLRSLEAEGRVRQQRRLQGIKQPVDAREEAEGNASWWQRLKSLWDRWIVWEHLIVAGREIKSGLVVTPAMGLTLFLAFGGVLGWMYTSTLGAITRQQDEARESRDLLIEMKTRLSLKEENDGKKFQELKQELKQEIQSSKDHSAAVETLMITKIAELKAQRK